MKKNILAKAAALAASSAMLFSLTACGSSSSAASTASEASSSSGTAQTSETAAAASTEKSTAASSEGVLASSGSKAAAGTEFKVGVVQYVDHASLNQIVENLEQELDAKGQELGVTFNYQDYEFNGQGDGTTLNQIASELISDDVDLIVAVATPTAQIMQAAAEGKNIPIVFSAVSDPVGAKLVDSLDAPGSNITGTSDALDTEDIMNLILAQNPDTKKVGLLYSKSEDASEQPVADAKKILEEKGIEAVEKTGTTQDEISTAADALIAEGVDAVFTPTDNTVMTAELAIYEKFAEAGIPHYAGADSFARNGAFCGYGVDYKALGIQTADMVAKILAEGADPATTPVETSDSNIATVNTETAAALGYDMDQVKKNFEPYCASVEETTTNKEME
ncbi:MAG TPA: ABC transporter [Lachnospiraceae bacterium]|jgi:putative ABC transport system substrate-binding protein|nr:ABC transporter [Lachnospiraceae bacterium]